ncbi:MAG: TetR/AcrR family transcriptional regulator [Desulfobacteraceae bacterium]|nr:TetR/AcrR family transcriptional regulator [Desulfobacteraceae bacterium]
MTEVKKFKSLDKSLRKQLIIDTAVKIFHLKGYRTATLDDVAHDLGLTRPAIYHYVSSKEDLLSQIYLQALGSFFDTIYEINKMDLTPPEKLRLYVKRHLKTVAIENLSMFTVFFSEENQLPENDFQNIRKEKLKFTKVVEDIIIEGMDQGYFRQINSKLYANAIIGMCNWLYMWYKPGKSSFSSDQIVEQFTTLIEGGLSLKNNKNKGDIPTTADRDKSAILKELKASLRNTANLVKELEKFS